jgi:hypothetical protein
LDNITCDISSTGHVFASRGFFVAFEITASRFAVLVMFILENIPNKSSSAVLFAIFLWFLCKFSGNFPRTSAKIFLG